MGGSSSVPESIANKVNEEQIRKEVGEAPVVVYTKSGCGYCDLAKELLGRERIHYQEHDLAQKEREDPEEAKRYVNGLVYVSRHKLVPQVFICGNFIGGYTELAKLRETNLLRDEILRCSDE
uniref:Glutaredoxin domain-containing protein n=1 Tax=Globodera rostochiensis TaxID=31243 RepID=A0A914GTT7_GLORO